MLDSSAYVDSFARDNLPPPELWPRLNGGIFTELSYPKRMNASASLLDDAVDRGDGSNPALRTSTEVLTYERLLCLANQVAHVLVDKGLVPGNRVLLRSANNAMLAVCFLAVLKAGGIAVPTMPLLRERELREALLRANVQFALCDIRLASELDRATETLENITVLRFNANNKTSLETLAASKPESFCNIICSHDDVALIAFTSGTTGSFKATAHFHRDLLAVADCFPASMLSPSSDDVYMGSAPFAFTFGLGANLLFPLRFGASGVLLEQCTPETVLEAVSTHGVTRLFTIPTLYRMMTTISHLYDLSSLKSCISSGEHLSPMVFEEWKRSTGLPLINSIGSTEMLHAFIVMPQSDIRKDAVGKVVKGYEAIVVDEEMNVVKPNSVGLLAVRGPTGCRYLDDPERQRAYVQNEWNLTGDAFRMDADGFCFFHSRADDIIVSAGYNISGVEVEAVLLSNSQISECAVVGISDSMRGQIVKAFVVLKDGQQGNENLTQKLQDDVKSKIAPYKYPRSIEYMDVLPKTTSGKIKRNELRRR